MQSVAIILICVGAAVVYGIAHDQVTARVCVEYFTIGHPPVFATDDPTLLGIGWGIIATWWVGLILGLLLVFAARVGSRPPRSAYSLLKPVARLMAVAGLAALAAGVTGYSLASAGVIRLVGPLADEVPAGAHRRFLADLWAHSASYLVGFVGGFIVCVRVWRSRSGRPPG